MSRTFVRYALTAALTVIVTSVVLSSCEGSERVSIAKPAAIYLGLGLADYGSTRWAMQDARVSEGNPLLRNHLEAKHLLLASALTGADYVLQKHGRKRSARVLRFAALAIAGRAVYLNTRNARRQR